ncbi:Son of sevenless 1 [Balamuthia mandrillaris]
MSSASSSSSSSSSYSSRGNHKEKKKKTSTMSPTSTTTSSESKLRKRSAKELAGKAAEEERQQIKDAEGNTQWDAHNALTISSSSTTSSWSNKEPKKKTVVNRRLNAPMLSWLHQSKEELLRQFTQSTFTSSNSHNNDAEDNEDSKQHTPPNIRQPASTTKHLLSPISSQLNWEEEQENEQARRDHVPSSPLSLAPFVPPSITRAPASFATMRNLIQEETGERRIKPVSASELLAGRRYSMGRVGQEPRRARSNTGSPTRPRKTTGTVGDEEEKESHAGGKQMHDDVFLHPAPSPLKRYKSVPFLNSWDFSPEQIYRTKERAYTLSSEVTRSSSSSLSSSSSSNTTAAAKASPKEKDQETDTTEESGGEESASETDLAQAELKLHNEVTKRFITMRQRRPAKQPGEGGRDARGRRARGKEDDSNALKTEDEQQGRSKETKTADVEREKDEAKEQEEQEEEEEEEEEESLTALLCPKESNSELMYRILGNGTKVITCGTVEALVLALANVDVQDKEYVDVFLATHKYFIDSLSFIKKLRHRFVQLTRRSQDASISAETKQAILYIQLRILNIVKKWLESYYEDFQNSAALMEALDGFQEDLEGSPESLKWVGHLKIARARAGNVRSRGVTLKGAPASLVPMRVNGGFLDFHPLEVARQLTIIDFEIFRSIKRDEYFRKAWSKNDQALAPNVIRWIDRFNQVCYWVATEIIMTPNPKQRSTVLQRFIEVAEHCLALNNFNGLMEIYTALNMSCIQRLKGAWKGVPQKAAQRLAHVELLMNPQQNYRNYRSEIATRVPPILPFQGINLTDLTFIEEIPDRTEEPSGWVNFDKMNLLGKVLISMGTYAAVGYRLRRVDPIHDYLRRPPLVLNEKELFLGSRNCEPSLESPACKPSAASAEVESAARPRHAATPSQSHPQQQQQKNNSNHQHNGHFYKANIHKNNRQELPLELAEVLQKKKAGGAGTTTTSTATAGQKETAPITISPASSPLVNSSIKVVHNHNNKSKTQQKEQHKSNKQINSLHHLALSTDSTDSEHDDGNNKETKKKRRRSSLFRRRPKADDVIQPPLLIDSPPDTEEDLHAFMAREALGVNAVGGTLRAKRASKKRDKRRLSLQVPANNSGSTPEGN